MSPSESRSFKTVSQEVCPSDGRSCQRTASVPAMAPSAYRLFLPGKIWEDFEDLVRVLGGRVYGFGFGVLGVKGVRFRVLRV